MQTQSTKAVVEPQPPACIADTVLSTTASRWQIWLVRNRIGDEGARCLAALLKEVCTRSCERALGRHGLLQRTDSDVSTRCQRSACVFTVSRAYRGAPPQPQSAHEPRRRAAAVERRAVRCGLSLSARHSCARVLKTIRRDTSQPDARCIQPAMVPSTARNGTGRMPRAVRQCKQRAFEPCPAEATLYAQCACPGIRGTRRCRCGCGSTSTCSIRRGCCRCAVPRPIRPSPM